MPFLCGAHCFKRPWALTGCLHNSEEGPILSSHRQGEAGPGTGATCARSHRVRAGEPGLGPGVLVPHPILLTTTRLSCRALSLVWEARTGLGATSGWMEVWKDCWLQCLC